MRYLMYFLTGAAIVLPVAGILCFVYWLNNYAPAWANYIFMGVTAVAVITVLGVVLTEEDDL